MPSVSLIIPIYQAEEFIEQNLTRLVDYCAQTPQIKELILVNDGSADRTHDIINTFLKTQNTEIQYLHLKKQQRQRHRHQNGY